MPTMPKPPTTMPPMKATMVSFWCSLSSQALGERHVFDETMFDTSTHSPEFLTIADQAGHLTCDVPSKHIATTLRSFVLREMCK